MRRYLIPDLYNASGTFNIVLLDAATVEAVAILEYFEDNYIVCNSRHNRIRDWCTQHQFSVEYDWQRENNSVERGHRKLASAVTHFTVPTFRNSPWWTAHGVQANAVATAPQRRLPTHCAECKENIQSLAELYSGLSVNFHAHAHAHVRPLLASKASGLRSSSVVHLCHSLI